MQEASGEEDIEKEVDLDFHFYCICTWINAEKASEIYNKFLSTSGKVVWALDQQKLTEVNRSNLK